jgi:predicted DNA-binding transcriptional regulator
LQLSKDQSIGAVILIASIVGLVAYTWLLYAFATIVLQITAFLAVAMVLVIMGWIGWTMATTPPPAPLEMEPTTPETTASTTSEEVKAESPGSVTK